MRIEQRGPIDPLTPKWRSFLLEALGGVDLDETQSAEVTRPDFACLSGLLVIEMKTLEEDGSARMDNLTEEMQKRADWPLFIGSAPIQAMVRHLDDPQSVLKKFIDRMGRAIVNHLKKANKQLGAYAELHPRKNQVRIMLLINEDHEIFEPAAVAYILQHALKRKKGDHPLYPNVDAVIFTSERHATIRNGKITFPILSVEGPGLESDVWKRDVIDTVFARWSQWSGKPTYKGDPKATDFTTIDDIPDQMARHDLWRLEYRRKAYMRGISNELLRDRFDEAFVVTTLKMTKASPFEPTDQVVEATMQVFTHIMIEMGERGITMPEFELKTERLAIAAERLHFHASVVDWFRNDFKGGGA